MKKNLLILSILLSLVQTVFSKERPIIRELNASQAAGNKISLCWTNPTDSYPPVTKLVIFRSLQPVGSYYDLRNAQEIAEIDSNSTSYTDTIKDYREYYYAVIAACSDQRYDIILPSINATVNGIHLKLPEKKIDYKNSSSAKEQNYSIESLRETPLPYLDLLESKNKKQLKMSDEAYSIAAELSKNTKIKKNIIKEVYIFEEDLISPDGGDDYLLFEILKNYFIQKKYSQAIEQLEKLIHTNRTKEVTNRAIFYLGESYYFSKDYKNSTTTFLKVYDEYPAIAKKWITSSLDLYVLPEQN